MNRREYPLVGLCIGLLGVLSWWAIAGARAVARDAVRIAAVRELQVGLELFYHDQATYPLTATPLPLGTSGTRCLHDQGFSGECIAAVTYLRSVNPIPTAGLSGTSACAGAENAYCYAGDATGFGISFEVERAHARAGLAKGLNCATESGFTPGACASRGAPTTQE